MTVTDALHDLPTRTYPHVPPRAEQHAAGPASPYPLYWLVRDWTGSETDEIGRGILERAIYVSPHAGHSDHQAAVEIITDALCRWSHPDDIRWCHLPDGGTGGYTIVGRALRSVSPDADRASGEDLED